MCGEEFLILLCFVQFFSNVFLHPFCILHFVFTFRISHVCMYIGTYFFMFTVYVLIRTVLSLIMGQFYRRDLVHVYSCVSLLMFNV